MNRATDDLEKFKKFVAAMVVLLGISLIAGLW